jgi:hypothetical protein
MNGFGNYTPESSTHFWHGEFFAEVCWSVVCTVTAEAGFDGKNKSTQLLQPVL